MLELPYIKQILYLTNASGDQVITGSGGSGSSGDRGITRTSNRPAMFLTTLNEGATDNSIVYVLVSIYSDAFTHSNYTSYGGLNTETSHVSPKGQTFYMARAVRATSYEQRFRTRCIIDGIQTGMLPVPVHYGTPEMVAVVGQYVDDILTKYSFA